MAEAKKTRETNFTRAYSAEGSEVQHDSNPVVTLVAEKVAEALKVPAMLRYFTDAIVGAGNAAMKADGGTIESATEKMQAVIDAIYDGSLKFRAASGESGLSIEEEHNVIAGELVVLGKFLDAAPALAWVQGVYARVKDQVRKSKDKATGVETEKTVQTRPDYNSLKNVAQIRAAIAKAQPAGTESDLDNLLKS